VPLHEPFVMRSAALLESRALRSLSRYARLMLDCFELEHCRHAGKENGYLIVTYNQFVEWGIARRFITRTITELEDAMLLVVEHRGRGTSGRGDPNLYRLTYLKSKVVPITGSPYFVEPTNDWENFKPRPPKSADRNRGKSSREGQGKNSFLGSPRVNRVDATRVNPRQRLNGGSP
jgi:hypothetical protein